MQLNFSRCAPHLPRHCVRSIQRVSLVYVLTAAAGLLLGGGVLDAAKAEGALEDMKGGILYRLNHGDLGQKQSGSRYRGARVARTNLAGIESDEESARPRRRVKRHRIKKRRAHRSSQRKKRVRIASLGGSFTPPKESKPKKSVTGGSGRVTWAASSGCLNSRLRSAIAHVAQSFGSVRVNSTCRSRTRNRRVGGARRSYHLSGNAADIRVFGNVRAAARYLRQVAGGYKHYGGGLFHIDTGPRRTW